MPKVNLGLPRQFASVPTSDSQRRQATGESRPGTPNSITFAGHDITVDVVTGNLLVSTADLEYAYYGLTLGIRRSYDAQRQFMSLSFMRNFPNVEPTPGWFSNWQSSIEPDLSEAWFSTLAEISLASAAGTSGSFVDRAPFARGLSRTAVLELLSSYGVPRRVLADLEWEPQDGDFVLRTTSGAFQLLAGRVRFESLVDTAECEVCAFDPLTGAGSALSSRFFYDFSTTTVRDIGSRVLVRKMVNGLGHAIQLAPTGGLPPYRDYVLFDQSGRRLVIRLDEQMTFPDGRLPSRDLRWRLATQLTDESSPQRPPISYEYSPEKLLRRVTFPTSQGNCVVTYHYAIDAFKGVLTAIEDTDGNFLRFEYEEDDADLDDRLAPRAKIKRITDAAGARYEFSYDVVARTTNATVTQGGTLITAVKYEYIEDTRNTRKRYVRDQTGAVTRGYWIDQHLALQNRDAVNAQQVRSGVTFSSDGRFNVIAEIDQIGRTKHYSYNDFNQIVTTTDLEGRITRFRYDVASSPTTASPNRYDLLRIERQNVVRTRTSGSPLIEEVVDITERYAWNKYDSNSSPYSADIGVQTTHRVSAFTNELGHTWMATYDDVGNNRPLSPTSVCSPLGVVTSFGFNDRGDQTLMIDGEGNTQTYSYDVRGQLVARAHPEGTVQCSYDPVSGWLDRIDNENGDSTSFTHYGNGRLKSVTDPVGDTIDYEYDSVGKVSRIIGHRPQVRQNPSTQAAPHFTTAYVDVPTTLSFDALGHLSRIIDAAGLQLVFEYDEAGRLIRVRHPGAAKPIARYVLDAAGQVLDQVLADDRIIARAFHPSGLPSQIAYPPWSDGVARIAGKVVNFTKYDYAGRLLSVRDSEQAGPREFVYDAAGQLTDRVDPSGFALHVDYDADGRITRVRDDSGDYDITITPDALGRPSVLSDSAALDGTLSWDNIYRDTLGAVQRVLRLFSTNCAPIGLTSTFDYDAAGRCTLVSHSHASPSAPTVLYREKRVYRPDGLVQDITGSRPNTFQYDALKQLVYEGDSNVCIDYDVAGNRLYRTDRDNTPSPSANIFDQFNRIVKDPTLGLTYGHDLNGNLASAGPSPPRSLYFDGASKLRVIDTPQQRIQLTYDEEGRLTSRAVKDLASGAILQYTFEYELTHPVLISANGRRAMLFTWGANANPLRLRVYQPHGAGSLLPNSAFPLQDGTNTPILFVDDQGTALASLTYDAWGAIVTANDPIGLRLGCGYRAGFLDPDTGLVLFGNRWLDPTQGRWLSPDPGIGALLQTVQGQPSASYRDLSNLYVYALNNPINRFDPTGLADRADPFSEQDVRDLADIAVDVGSVYIDMLSMLEDTPPWFQRLAKGLGVGTDLIDFYKFYAAWRKGDTADLILAAPGLLLKLPGIPDELETTWNASVGAGKLVNLYYRQFSGFELWADAYVAFGFAEREEQTLRYIELFGRWPSR